MLYLDAEGKAQTAVGPLHDAMRDLGRDAIWFDYAKGKIIKMETTTDVEGEAPSDILSAMVPQAGISGGGMMGGGAPGMGGGGMMAGGGDEPGMGGMPGAGFGGMQTGGQEEPKSHAKFHSLTVVELVPAKSAAAPKKK